MKKILTLAAGALIGLSASLPAEAATVTRYTKGTAIQSQSDFVSGNKYFIYAYSKGVGRFVHKDQTYMASKGLETIPEAGTTDASYVYTITKNDNGSFTIANDGVAFPINGHSGVGKGDMKVDVATANGATAAEYTLSTTAVEGAPSDFADKDKLFYVELANATYVNSGVTTHIITNGDTNNGQLGYWENCTGDISDDGQSYTALAFYRATAEEEAYDVPETSTADAPKYYRIISNRAATASSDYWGNAFPGKYLQIGGEQAGATTTVGTGDDARAYWWFEDAGNGAAYIHSMVTDYKLTGPSKILATMTETGTPFYFINVTDQDGITIDNTFAISTSNPLGDESCLDQSNYAENGQYGAKVCWSPISTREDKGDKDNGSAWYFELATDAEVAAATTAYIEAVRTNYTTAVNAVKDPVIATLNALSGVMDTKDAIAAIDAAGLGEFSATTIAEANAAMSAARNFTLPESTLSDEIRANMASSLVGNYVQIRSRLVNGTSGHDHPYVTVNRDLNGTDLNIYVTRPEDNPIRSIWEVVASDTDGKVWLRNLYANQYLQLNDAENTNNPISAESGDAFTVRYSIAKNGFGFDAGNSLDGTEKQALRAAVIETWTGATVRGDLTSNDSWFDLVAVDGEVTVATSKGDNKGDVVLNFGEGVTPNANAEYNAETVKLIVTPVTPETPAERAVVGTEIAAIAIVNGSVTLTEMAEGNYTITAPAGFFTVNGKLSAPIKQSFNVAADGTTTGVDEIGVATSGKQVIYDLQGRRVQRATKGLYIINGVKTLVK